MKKLLLDTDVWLRLIEDRRKAPLLSVIEGMVTAGAVDLVVTETVFREFNNRCAEVSKRTANTLSSHIKAVREALTQIPVNETTLPHAVSHLMEMQQRVYLFGTGSEAMLDRIKALMEYRVVPHSPEAERRAGMRARERKAPFFDEKNSFADALNIESYGDLLRAKADPCAFVTHNVNDFSLRGGDQRLPHPDIAGYFNGTDSCYFIDLLEALNFVDRARVSETMLRMDPTVGDICTQRIKYFEQHRKPKEKNKPTTIYVLEKICTMPIAEKRAATLQPADIVAHCKLQRRGRRGRATVNQDFTLLRSAFKFAAQSNPDISDLAFLGARPQLIRENLIGASTNRSRRPTQEEIDRLLARLEEGDEHGRAVNPVADIVRFTLASALRISEICRIRWQDLHESDRTCSLYDRGSSKKKSKDPIRIGFTEEAWSMIQRQPSARDKEIFPFPSASISTRVSKTNRELGMPGVTLKSLQFEGEIRMYLAGIPPDKICEMTGHMDLNAVTKRCKAAADAAAAERAADLAASLSGALGTPVDATPQR